MIWLKKFVSFPIPPKLLRKVSRIPPSLSRFSPFDRRVLSCAIGTLVPILYDLLEDEDSTVVYSSICALSHVTSVVKIIPQKASLSLLTSLTKYDAYKAKPILNCLSNVCPVEEMKEFLVSNGIIPQLLPFITVGIAKKESLICQVATSILMSVAISPRGKEAFVKAPQVIQSLCVQFLCPAFCLCKSERRCQLIEIGLFADWKFKRKCSPKCGNRFRKY